MTAATTSSEIDFDVSPAPRTALHTAVPTVLTTFLTATDDTSSPPTADEHTTADNCIAVSDEAPAGDQPTIAALPASACSPPSVLIPSLSTSALHSLLNFRSSASALSTASSSSSLTAALRSLRHVLDHPLLPPARPDDRRGYELGRLSRPVRRAGGEERRSSVPAYDEMGGRVSEQDALHRRLQDELDAIQHESSLLAAHYPLDPLNVSILQADSDVIQVRPPRKERLDYMSAEHSRAINRVQRDRKKLEEEEALNNLLTAIGSTQSAHTLPPLTASTHRSRNLSVTSTLSVQRALSDESQWS